MKVVAKQKVFIVRNALARIRETEVEIVCGPKMTWALRGGKRHLLGTTAFFTRKAAEVRKLGLLRKVADNPVLDNIRNTMYMRHDAIEQLKAYKETGVLH